MRPGALVRSEHLGGLTEDGWQDLRAHGVRTCVDLRSAFEVAESPYAPPLPGVERVAAPLEEGLLDDPEFAGWATSGLLSTALYYAPYLRRWPDRLAAALAVVRDAPPGGVLVHCQRGRDRTGLVTLALLSLVGVPHEVIVADHLHTDARLRDRGVAMGHVGLDGEAEIYAERGTTAEATLHALLADLVVPDLLGAQGWTPDDVTSLRARLL